MLAIISQTMKQQFAVASEKMVHPGGFEPPTARFVAEYSIQLSYGCIRETYFTADLMSLLKRYQVIWCIREDSNLRPLGS